MCKLSVFFKLAHDKIQNQHFFIGYDGLDKFYEILKNQIKKQIALNTRIN